MQCGLIFALRALTRYCAGTRCSINKVIALSSNFHESFGQQDVPPPSDRSTGLVLAGAALLVSILYRSSPVILLSGLLLSAVLFFLSLAFPRLLGPLNIIWFAIGKTLHAIVSPLTLGVLFFLVVAPFGFIMRLFRDPLLATPPKDTVSYWVDMQKPSTALPPASMKNQF